LLDSCCCCLLLVVATASFDDADEDANAGFSGAGWLICMAELLWLDRPEKDMGAPEVEESAIMLLFPPPKLLKPPALLRPPSYDS